MKQGLLIAAIALLALLATGCKSTGTGAANHEAVKGQAVTIAPGKFYEACDEWKMGQQVDYVFSASKPVYFDVHYHGPKQKEFAARDERTAGSAGSFTIEADATYCCMWKNNGSGSTDLTYDFKVK